MGCVNEASIYLWSLALAPNMMLPSFAKDTPKSFRDLDFEVYVKYRDEVYVSD